MTDMAMNRLSSMGGRSKSLSQIGGKASDQNSRGERKVQHILGDSGIVNEQLVPTLTARAG